jgi:hypothetical protein
VISGCILRCASWLTPSDERAEWLAEWGGELAYVRSRTGPGRAALFAMGAFPDALWLARNSQSPLDILILESPLRCLLFLAALLIASFGFAWRSPTAFDARPEPYLEPEKLAMAAPGINRATRVPAITVAEYREFANRAASQLDAAAFYAPRAVWIGSRRLVFAIATPDLFRTLGIPAAAPGLILDRMTWLARFGHDPAIVGKTVNIGGTAVKIVGVLPDGSWRLPGIVDGWLLDSARLAELSPDTQGFMLVRLKRPVLAGIRVPAGAPGERDLWLAPLSQGKVGPIFEILLGIALLLVPAAASLTLSEFPAGRHARPWLAHIRWWTFLAAKIGLLLPTAFFGIVALGVAPGAPQGILFALILAFRWVLYDQRRRCPVCLRLLSHPVRIGEASHTFLDWYGTELICARGHGFLHVPEIRTSCYAQPRWLTAA